MGLRGLEEVVWRDVEPLHWDNQRAWNALRAGGGFCLVLGVGEGYGPVEAEPEPPRPTPEPPSAAASRALHAWAESAFGAAAWQAETCARLERLRRDLARRERAEDGRPALSTAEVVTSLRGLSGPARRFHGCIVDLDRHRVTWLTSPGGDADGDRSVLPLFRLDLVTLELACSGLDARDLRLPTTDLLEAATWTLDEARVEIVIRWRESADHDNFGTETHLAVSLDVVGDALDVDRTESLYCEDGSARQDGEWVSHVDVTPRELDATRTLLGIEWIPVASPGGLPAT